MFDSLAFLLDNDLDFNHFVISANTIKLLLLVCLAFIIHLIARTGALPLIEMFIKKTETKFDDPIVNRKLLKRAVHLLPATIISAGLPAIFESDTQTFELITKALNLYFILIGIALFDAFLNVVRDVYDMSNKTGKVGITGVIQALKVVGVIVSVILAISVLAGKSPVYFITGLGAFTAILMLIFKDPLLGLVAGVQLSAMDLVRKGDWLEIPKHGADGKVVDISLTTVKVQNWDMTFTAIPAYELVSSSFKNWRSMSESGGRRIKRSIRISVTSIRFLSDDDIERLRKIKILRPYIDERLSEIKQIDALELTDDDMACSANRRRLTNIGTFREYCAIYLTHHTGINQDMTVMVRQLAQTEFGLPLEIYAFTSDVGWVAHECVQSDIFDHLLSIASEFGLVIYQR